MSTIPQPLSDQSPRVAVLVDTSTGWGRRLIQGIATYSRRHGPWHLAVQAVGQSEPLRVPVGWSGDGVIARISNPHIARHVQSLGVPAVNISAIHLKGWNFPTATTDVNASGLLAAEYFIGRGFRHFAYSGAEQFSYVRRHREAFQQALNERGFELIVDRQHASPQPIAASERRLASVIQWLRMLPKPVAIFTWATQRGFELLDACRYAGLAVPHEVAVLGGDYDEILCEISSPPMSGMITASEQIGLEAAAMLDRLMKGDGGWEMAKWGMEGAVLFPPTGIVTNASTDALAVDDHELVQVMRFIDRKAFEPIQMSDILRAVPVARRTLERKFKRAFGRSPTDEIRLRRVNRAKRLLSETDMSLSEIAETCGFCTYAYLSHIFSRETGVTPSAFRRRSRGR